MWAGRNKWICNLKKTIARLFPPGSMPLEPPTGRVPLLWKNRAAAYFLGGSHQVIFRLLPFQGGSQKLIDFNRAVGRTVREANLKYRPISDIQQHNNSDQDRKVTNQPTEPAPDHQAISPRAKAVLPNSHARTSIRYRVCRNIFASHGIFSIIGERS